MKTYQWIYVVLFLIGFSVVGFFIMRFAMGLMFGLIALTGGVIGYGIGRITKKDDRAK
jgi:hypothetical protein